MNPEALQKRVEELQNAVNNLVKQHDILMGHLQEAKYQLELSLKPKEEEVEVVQEEVVEV
jgi:hypothetical protein